MNTQMTSETFLKVDRLIEQRDERVLKLARESGLSYEEAEVSPWFYELVAKRLLAPPKRGDEGFMLVSAVMAALIFSIVLLGQLSLVRYTTKASRTAQERTLDLADKTAAALETLQDLKEHSTGFMKQGTVDDACAQISQCSFEAANGKTVHACGGVCTRIDGIWYLGSQACDLGVTCVQGEE